MKEKATANDRTLTHKHFKNPFAANHPRISYCSYNFLNNFSQPMDNINFLMFIFFSAVLTRVFLLIKLDLHYRRAVLLKFLFGAYSLLAFLPVFSKSTNDKHQSTIRILNWLLVPIYLTGILILLIVWIKYG